MRSHIRDEDLTTMTNLAHADPSVRFWDRFAERYAKRPVRDAAAYERKLALTQAHLSPDARVLEFGCGTGSTTLVHAPRVRRLLAIDTSAQMISICRRKQASANAANVEFRQASLFDLDVAHGAFDAVLGLNVLHLLDDYRSTVRRVHDLLRPDGVFVTSTVCMKGINPAIGAILRIGAAIGLIPRVAFIAPNELETAITTTGFEVVEKVLPDKRSGALFLIAKKTAP